MRACLRRHVTDATGANSSSWLITRASLCRAPPPIRQTSRRRGQAYSAGHPTQNPLKGQAPFSCRSDTTICALDSLQSVNRATGGTHALPSYQRPCVCRLYRKRLWTGRPFRRPGWAHRPPTGRACQRWVPTARSHLARRVGLRNSRRGMRRRYRPQRAERSSSVVVNALASRMVQVAGRFSTPEDAWRRAGRARRRSRRDHRTHRDDRRLPVPPREGPPSRDFPTLHFDFGVPLVPAVSAAVTRLTVRHVPATASFAQASRRFAASRPLLSGRAWPGPGELVRRFVA